MFIGGPERLNDVLRQADYLAITLSLSPETRGLLDERQLRLMKPTAYLINVARAEIVDELALYRALATAGIAGAALDVWYRYPTAVGTTLPASATIPRTRQRDHDPTRVRLDGGHARCAGKRDR